MMRPQGFLTLAKLVRPDGTEVSTQDAVDAGLVVPFDGKAPKDWGIAKHEIPLGYNNFTNEGRQAIVYAVGFRRPIIDFVCTQFGIGTGTRPTKTTDVALESALTFYDSNGDTTPDSMLKPVTKVTFPYPFVMDVEISLGFTEANGYLLTEFALFTGSSGVGAGGTMLSRQVNLGYNKTSSLAPSFIYRQRF